MPVRPLLRLLGLCCLLVASGSRAAAYAPAPPSTDTLQVAEPLAKLSTDLLRIHHAVQRGLRDEPLHDALGRPVGDYVVVDVTVRGGDAGAALRRLAALGLREGSAFGAVVSGLLPVEALGAAAAMPEVASIASALALTRRGLPAPLHTGSVTGQSDRALRADEARSGQGVSGAGTCMGVLSDSYDTLGGAATDVATGDLPPGVRVLRELDRPASDEGRAMIQLAFNVAPGLAFSFHTAFLGQASFASGILALADDGCLVIVDDVIYFAEPMFQDGIIAQAVDRVVQRGHAYFSSAGNNADASYEAPFRTSGLQAAFTIPDFPAAGETFSVTGALHDFDPSPGIDPFQQVTVPAGAQVILSFQWDQPFLAADPTGQTGSASDYDLLLVQTPSPTAAVVAASVSDNRVTGNPVEVIQYTNQTDAAQTLYLVIVRRAGPDAGLMKWVEFRRQAAFQYVTPGAGTSTTYGHSNAAGAFATGAAAWFNTPAWEPTLTEPVLNAFSSYGGTPILFDVRGNRLSAPEDRMKPDAVGADGDSNTFFGSPDVNGDGFPNFFGTSASAPNVAAVAALVLEASGFGLAPRQTYGILRTTADDIRNVQGRNANTAPGYDRRSGYGFIRADQAVMLAGAVPPEAEALAAAFPNPFRDRATLYLSVGEEQAVRAHLYDAIGRRVAVVFDGAAGPDAPVPLTLRGGGLASGVYVVRVVGETFTASQRVTVLR